MAQTVFRCPTGMPTDLLAAWHDHTLSADQTANVSAHITDCPACQAYLSDYAQADTALRRAEVPALQERIWRGVRADIAQSPHRRAGLPRPAVLGGLSAALAVTILFVAFFVFVLDNKGSTHSISIAPSATASAIPTNTVIPTPTVTPLQVSPSQGWVQDASLNFGKSVSFARSAPYTGYACGNTATDIGLTQSLLFSVTYDGGRIWSIPITTPVNGANCQIYINPTDAQDLILEGNALWGPGDGTESELGFHYRSLNGGQTWTKLVFPAPDNNSYIWLKSPLWIGNTLFAVALQVSQMPTPPPAHQVAVSINGGPLVWADQTAPLQGGNLRVIYSFAVGATYYIELSGTCYSGCPSQIAQTSDKGATWSTAALKDIEVGGIVLGEDGKTLIGFANDQLYTSSNAAQTWVALPAIPGVDGTNGMLGDPISGSTPDGTIYVNITPGSGSSHTSINGVYKLLLGASTWTKVSSLFYFITISSDINGHPIALWGPSSYDGGEFSPGFAYHAA